MSSLARFSGPYWISWPGVVGGALFGGPGIGVKAMAELEEAEVSKYVVRAIAGPDGLGAGTLGLVGRRDKIWAMIDFLART